MIIFKVDTDRFYFEYQHWIQQLDNRHVEWFVDEKRYIHLFVPTDQGVGYYYTCPEKKIPPKIQSIIGKPGEVLGVYNPPTETDTLSEKKLQYNVMKDEGEIGLYKDRRR